MQKDLSLKDPLGQLSNVKMCVMCQAMGTVKRQYGFRVMDEQCEACNGARGGRRRRRRARRRGRGRGRGRVAVRGVQRCEGR